MRLSVVLLVLAAVMSGCWRPMAAHQQPAALSEVPRTEPEPPSPQELAVAAARARRDPIFVYAIEAGWPNSARGVDVHIRFENTSGRDYKYLRFVVRPFNAVDDPVECEVRRCGPVRLEITGPVGGHRAWPTSTWDDVWYNSTVRYLHLDAIEIVYMDDAEVTLRGDSQVMPLVWADLPRRPNGAFVGRS